MLLHTNRDLFEQTILHVAKRSNIEPAIIEKDYFVSLLLKELADRLPAMIFKGGTSLSKCHKVIKRFSEDIDITLDENHLSQGNRKSVKIAIEESCSTLGFTITNIDDIKSRMDFNHYKIEYPGIFTVNGLKPNIEIDTIFSIKSFPSEHKLATSILYDYLIDTGVEKFINDYELAPFCVNTQSLDRTFIDKIFALCDYYLEGKTSEHSRHLYDIHKLLPLISDINSIRRLAKETREARINSPFCKSADPAIDINATLKSILDENFYEKDYKDKTSVLLYEDVPYEKTKFSISKIIESKIF